MVGEDEIRGQLHDWRERPETVAIFTDIDGTLAPIVPTPDMSEVSAELKELLRQLSEMYLLVAGISGRKTEDALDLVGLADVVYFGNHGFEILRDGEVEVTPEALPYLEKVQELEARAREELGPLGAFVEEKGITASVHYRNAPPGVGERSVEFVKREGERLGLRITVGRGVVEARPPSGRTRARPSVPWSRSTAPRGPCSSATTLPTSTPSGSWWRCARKGP